MRSVHPVLEEQVEVARTAGDPEMFLLRGRLYAVRSVLARWREPGGWRWSGPGRAVTAPAGAPTGGGTAVIGSVPVEPGHVSEVPGGADDGQTTTGRVVGDLRQPRYRPTPPPCRTPPGRRPHPPQVQRHALPDRELWRVEAAAGMSARVEVFDLCRDVAAGPPRWTVTLVEE
jgi:Family of unknown function (DUF6504)